MADTSTQLLSLMLLSFSSSLIPEPAHSWIPQTLGTLRPLLKPAGAGDSESAVRTSAQIHPQSRHRVRIWQWRLAAHPSGATRGGTGTHLWTDRRDLQIFLWVLLVFYMLCDVRQMRSQDIKIFCQTFRYFYFQIIFSLKAFYCRAG